MFIRKLVSIILLLTLFTGCACHEKYQRIEEIISDTIEKHDNPDLYAQRRYPESFYKTCKFEKKFREWAFVNQNKLLYSSCYGYDCEYVLDNIANIFNTYDAWFAHYIAYDKLKQKWFKKPMPKGMKEFIEKCVKCY